MLLVGKIDDLDVLGREASRVEEAFPDWQVTDLPHRNRLPFQRSTERSTRRVDVAVRSLQKRVIRVPGASSSDDHESLELVRDHELAPVAEIPPRCERAVHTRPGDVDA